MGRAVPPSPRAVRRALELVAEGADPNARDKAGYAPLHVSAARGDGDLARVLLDAGADVRARTAAGDTPLYVATHWGHPGVARLLVERGADPLEANDLGKTALDLCYQERRGPEMERALRCLPERRRPARRQAPWWVRYPD